MHVRLLVGLSATALLSLLALSVPVAGAAAPGPLSWFPALLAIALELFAVPLSGVSYFSAAGPLYLALVLAGGAGVRLAVVSCLAATLLRWLIRDQARADRLGAVVADLLPLALAGWLSSYSRHPAVVLDAYAFSFWLLTPMLLNGPPDWRRLRQRLLGLWLGSWLLALVWNRLDGAAMLALTPALWCLQFAADRALDGYRAREREDLRAHLERSYQLVDSAKEEKSRVEALLRAQVAESTWQAEVTRQLGLARDRQQLLQIAFRLLRSAALLRSLAVLELDPQASTWNCLAQQSPQREWLESAALLGQGEPPRTLTWNLQPPFLPDEEQSLFYPLGERHVFYLGGLATPTWSDSQRQLLSLVLQSCAERWPQVTHIEDLRQQAGGAQQLSREVGQLEDLLKAASALAAPLDADQVVDELMQSLDTLPGESRLYMGVDGTYRATAEGMNADLVVEAVRESGLPLLIEDFRSSRFSPLKAGEKSLLAAPVWHESSMFGVVILGAKRTGSFERNHQDQLALLGLLAGQALGNAALHGQVVEALESQRESEAQLIQSSKMAAVGQLAAGVAHELNTPLGAVVLGLEASSRAAKDNPLLTTALDAALQAKEIVSKLLYYSRDARKGAQASDLNRLIRDTLQLIGTQLRLDKLRVDLDLSELAPIRVNQNEIQQVITNLILNARDAVNESGNAQRNVELQSRQEGDQLVLRVFDSGAGVAVENRTRIFEPFFTTKPVGKGTGLGLSVSQQIVEAHGGSLGLEECPGRTCFALRLPIAESQPS